MEPNKKNPQSNGSEYAEIEAGYLDDRKDWGWGRFKTNIKNLFVSDPESRSLRQRVLNGGDDSGGGGRSLRERVEDDRE